MDRVTGTSTHKVNCPQLPRHWLEWEMAKELGGVSPTLTSVGHLDYKVVIFLPKPEGVIAHELLLHSQSKQEGRLRSRAAPKGLFTKVRSKQRADTKAGPATWSTNIDYHASPATGQESSAPKSRASGCPFLHQTSQRLTAPLPCSSALRN